MKQFKFKVTIVTRNGRCKADGSCEAETLDKAVKGLTKALCDDFKVDDVDVTITEISEVK